MLEVVKENNFNNSNSFNKIATIEDVGSIGISAIQDLSPVKLDSQSNSQKNNSITLGIDNECMLLENIVPVKNNESLRSLSSATELTDCKSASNSDETVIYQAYKSTVTVSFGVTDCKHVDLSTNSNIKRIIVCHNKNDTNIDCEIVENSDLSETSQKDENMNETALPNESKKFAVAVNLDIKKNNITDVTTENSKVLILNTDAIEKLSHVIVQPPNYKLVKRKHFDQSKINSSAKRKSVFGSPFKNEKTALGVQLKQKGIEAYYSKRDVLNSIKVSEGRSLIETGRIIVDGTNIARDDAQDMSKNSGVADAVKCERVSRSSRIRKGNESPRSVKLSGNRREAQSKNHDIKTGSFAPQSADCNRHDSARSNSLKKHTDSLQLSGSSKVKACKSSVTRPIPQHKIVAGEFAQAYSCVRVINCYAII